MVSVLLVLCSIAFPGILAAQVVLTGRITAGGQAVARAMVKVQPGSQETTTDSMGIYTVNLAATAAAVVDVIATGFEPVWRRIEFSGADTVTADFALVPMLYSRMTVNQEITKGSQGNWRSGFLERRKQGKGEFLDRAEIDTLGSTLSEVLENSKILNPFLRLVPRSTECGGGLALGGVLTLTKTRDSRTRSYEMTCVVDTNRCYTTLFLDGEQFWISGTPPGPPDIDEIRREDVEAIEVYFSAQQSLRFGRTFAPCGVMAVWTNAAP